MTCGARFSAKTSSFDPDFHESITIIIFLTTRSRHSTRLPASDRSKLRWWASVTLRPVSFHIKTKPASSNGSLTASANGSTKYFLKPTRKRSGEFHATRFRQIGQLSGSKTCRCLKQFVMPCSEVEETKMAGSSVH